MSNIILDYKKEGFSVKVLDNSIKFFIKEKNIDFSKFRALEQGDTIENLLLIRDREGGTWSPGGTDYFLLENLTLRKIVSTQKNHKSENFRQLVVDEFRKYNNMNFFLIRTPWYKETGRYQTFDEAKEIDDQIKGLLDDYNLPYEVVQTSRESVNYIVDKIMNYLEENGYKG